MDTVSLCPFEAGAFVWEAAPGESSLTVLVKGTFTLAPGELVVAPGQDPLAGERHLEDSALASLYWSGDYAPVKRKVDVTLVGSAYASGDRPVTSLVARLAVGDFAKAVRVTGDRAWALEGGQAGQLRAGAPAPFLRLPLRYERAALSADNPVGFDGNAPAVQGAPAAPNLEPVDGDARARVPCFGPVAPSWRARRKLLDDAAVFWAYGVVRAPYAGAPSLGPAPARFDFAFFNSAPVDQQIDLLRAGTPIVLEHLHPEHPRLETRLSPLRPQVFRVPPADALAARVEEIILRCDSLWIDTDRGVVVLTWRGVADAPGGEARVGTLVVDADPQGKKLRWDRVEKRFAEVHVPTERLPGADAPRPSRASAPLLDPLSVRHDGRRPAPGARESAPAIAPADLHFDDLTQRIEPPSDRAPTALMAAKPGRGLPAGKAQRATPGDAGPALRKDLTIDRYAELVVALGRAGAARGAVLKAHLLTEPGWTMVDQRWKTALAREAEEGGRALLLAFDEAFLAEQSRLGKPIGVAEYARIQVGLERGQVGRVLGELELELADLMRLQRVWAKRLAESAELTAKLARAVEEGRKGRG